MTYPENTLLVARPDTEPDLVAIKKFISEKQLSKDDVKLSRKNGLLELRTRRDVKYG